MRFIRWELGGVPGRQGVKVGEGKDFDRLPVDVQTAYFGHWTGTPSCMVFIYLFSPKYTVLSFTFQHKMKLATTDGWQHWRAGISEILSGAGDSTGATYRRHDGVDSPALSLG